MYNLLNNYETQNIMPCSLTKAKHKVYALY